MTAILTQKATITKLETAVSDLRGEVRALRSQVVALEGRVPKIRRPSPVEAGPETAPGPGDKRYHSREFQGSGG